MGNFLLSNAHCMVQGVPWKVCEVTSLITVSQWAIEEGSCLKIEWKLAISGWDMWPCELWLRGLSVISYNGGPGGSIEYLLTKQFQADDIVINEGTGAVVRSSLCLHPYRWCFCIHVMLLSHLIHLLHDMHSLIVGCMPGSNEILMSGYLQKKPTMMSLCDVTMLDVLGLQLSGNALFLTSGPWFNTRCSHVRWKFHPVPQVPLMRL